MPKEDNPVTIGTRGLAIIKARETLRLIAYRPTPNDVWTLGWGHTKGVKKGDTCTKTQADAWLVEDTASAARDVERYLPGVALTQGMRDALGSLVYNCGAGAIDEDSLIGTELRAGDYFAACASFIAYRKQTNRKTGMKENVLGLAARRIEEMALFFADGLPS